MENLPFEGSEFNARLSRLIEVMLQRGWDALLTFTQENQYWLTGYETTGFHSFPQALLVTRDGTKLLVTRQLEIENACENAYDLPAISYQDDEDPGSAMVDALAKQNLARSVIGIEKQSPWVTVSVYETLKTNLPQARLEDCSGTIEWLRSIKSSAELAYMRAAARCIGDAMRAGIAAVGVGANEFDVAARLSGARIAAGSHFTRNPTYVTSGPRSARGHATWIGRTIEDGDIVYFEAGANVRHYDAGLIRTAVAGSATDEMLTLHAASCEALEAALSVLGPGVLAREVHEAAVDVFQRAGVEAYFDHRMGYGIGIEFLTWIERGGVSLDAGSSQRLQSNMTLHLIPFLKIPGKFSIGVSETVRVSDTGAEVLETGCPRTLVEC